MKSALPLAASWNSSAAKFTPNQYTKMAKVKMKKTGISSRDEYEQKVNRAAMLDVECTEIIARYKLLEQRLKARKEVQLKARQKEQKELLAACCKYAFEHQDEVLKKGMRYGETTQARYGFQMGNYELVTLGKITWKMVAEKIAAKGKAFAARFLTVKEPDVNKVALKDAHLHGQGKDHLTAEQLAEIGCEVVQADSYYIKPKSETEN